jgi:hypothetical protein
MADTLEQIAVQLAFQLGFVCSCRVLKDYPPDGPVCHGCRVTSRIRYALQSIARERPSLEMSLRAMTKANERLLDELREAEAALATLREAQGKEHADGLRDVQP